MNAAFRLNLKNRHKNIRILAVKGQRIGDIVLIIKISYSKVPNWNGLFYFMIEITSIPVILLVP